MKFFARVPFKVCSIIYHVEEKRYNTSLFRWFNSKVDALTMNVVLLLLKERF